MSISGPQSSVSIPNNTVDEADSSAFAAAVRSGFAERPRSLSAIWHYDSLGSILFEAICHLPEYDLTRVEDAILSSAADAVIAAAGDPVEILELGSGVATKTVALLRAAAKRSKPMRYRPIDISDAALQSAERRLQAVCPEVECVPMEGDYFDVLTALPPAAGKRLVIFLGSNIGNYEGEGALTLLRTIAGVLQPGDTLLIGAALMRPVHDLIDAYDDPTGVTAAFNKNVLTRINRELGGTIPVRQFDHRVSVDLERGVVDSFLVARGAQSFDIAALGEHFEFADGERIHTESACKYTVDSLRKLGDRAGLAFVDAWTDADQHFCDMLFRAC